LTFVIKRNSTKKEKYSQRKLERSIELAAKDAKLGSAKAKALAREIGKGIHAFARKRRTIKAVQLRRMALRRLESRSRAAVSAWRRHDRKKQYR